MKSLVVFGFLISAAMAQRPSFAGSSAKGYPELASRFKGAESSSDTTSTVANRLGVDADVSTTTVRIPVDARGDEELVKRVQDWPRQNQPFWFINSQQIEEHRNPQGSVSQGQQIQSRSAVGEGSYRSRSPTPVPQRSSFLGSSSRQ